MNCVQGLKAIPLSMKKEIENSMNMGMRHLLSFHALYDYALQALL
jgi:hypothetical protein